MFFCLIEEATFLKNWGASVPTVSHLARAKAKFFLMLWPCLRGPKTNSAVTCMSLTASAFALCSPSAHSTHCSCNSEPQKCPCPFAGTMEVSPFGGWNCGWCLGIWERSVLVNVWSVSTVWCRDWISLLSFRWRSVRTAALFQWDLQGQYWKIFLHLQQRLGGACVQLW